MLRGVDGCRGGWLAVWTGNAADTVEAAVFSKAHDLLIQRGFAVTAIDIPIGLPAATSRRCDLAARRVLGLRGVSVFPTPVRAVLATQTYEEACAASFAASGKKLSKQTFGIVPKIREVDTFLRNNPSFRTRVFEVHPEVSFTYWNGGQILSHSKHSGFGFAERLGLVEQAFPGAAEQIRRSFPSREVADDDILDALATLWTAWRIHAGTAVRIGDVVEEDEHGLPMQIVA